VHLLWSDQLDSVYNVAGIELAVSGSSNWASLLSVKDLPLLEYATDLKVCYLFTARLMTKPAQMLPSTESCFAARLCGNLPNILHGCVLVRLQCFCLKCFDDVGWAVGRASGL